jgi:hypothetical protein
VHYGEAAGGRIDNEITGLCDGADQPRDQIDQFRMQVDSVINLFPPLVRDTVIAPPSP